MFCFSLAAIHDEDQRSAFEELYLKLRDRLFYLAFSILKNEHAAEDAVSEAFCNIAAKFDSLRDLSENQLRAYCIVTVKNTSFNLIKAQTKTYSVEDADEAESLLVDNEALKYVDRIYLKEKISALDGNDSEILLLFYFYRYTVIEIARLKKISYSAAKKRLQRARSHLKKLIEEDD